MTLVSYLHYCKCYATKPGSALEKIGDFVSGQVYI